MKRGQISVEYLIVVGFVVFVVIAMLTIAFFYAANTRDRITLTRANALGEEVASAAALVGSQGHPSLTTFNIVVPNSLQKAVITTDSGNSFVVLTVTTSGGENILSIDIGVETQGNATGEFMIGPLNSGNRILKAFAQSNGIVEVCEDRGAGWPACPSSP